jgi:hypothetical protein
MQGFRPGVIDKLFHQNATRILKLENAITHAAEARAILEKR